MRDSSPVPSLRHRAAQWVLLPRAVGGTVRRGLLLVAASVVLALGVLAAQAVSGGSLDAPGVYLLVVVLLVTGLVVVVVGVLGEAVAHPDAEDVGHQRS